MRVSALREAFVQIPDHTFAPNVILTGMVARSRLRAIEISVPQNDRKSGVVSIRKWKLLKVAVQSLVQTVRFAISTR